MQVSDPVLRVTQLDTIEHVTDFDSAADHVRTREKWQEMGVPMMQGLSNMRDYDISSVKPRGAFEKRGDTTSYDTDAGLDEAALYLKALQKTIKGKRSKSRSAFEPLERPVIDPEARSLKRWKFEGPWLPGMGADDFVAYLTKEISKRKDEFNAHLISHVKNLIYTTRKYAASQSGETAPMDMEEAERWHAKQEKQWRDISDEEVAVNIKALRKQVAIDPLGSRLFQTLIVPFLRLPTIKVKNRMLAQDTLNSEGEKLQFDQDITPLSTHPSAGLGYLRTKSYLTNHPILGPQAQPAPITARVIQPRSTVNTKEAFARLGVAGFVANDQYRNTDRAARGFSDSARDVEQIDIDTPGGRKVFVQPHYASMTTDGRVLIKLQRSVGAEVQVARGELDDKPPSRENADDTSKPLLHMSMGMGKSGIKELDEQSEQAQRFTKFLGSIKPQGKGQPGPGFPGVADALRSE